MECTFLDRREVALDQGSVDVWFCRKGDPMVLSTSRQAAQSACESCDLANPARSLAGSAIEIDHVTGHLAALNAIASAADSIDDLPRVLETALSMIVDALHVEGGWVALDAEPVLEVSCHVGLTGEQEATVAALRRTEGVVGIVFREQVGVVVDGSEVTPDASRGDSGDGVGTLFVLPLKAQDRVLGVLGVLAAFAGTPRAFAATDVAFATTAAAQLAGVVGRSLAEREQRDRLDQQRLLLEAAETVNSSLDAASLETTILAEAARLMNAPKAALLVARGDVLVAQEVYGLGERCKQLFVVSLADSAWGRAVLSGETVAVNDVDDEEPAAGDLAREGEYHSFLASPLLSYKGTSGALTVFYDRVRQFPENEETLLRTFAVQAAIALDNRRLMREKDQMAARDGLTGVYNRSYLELVLERTTKEMRRNGGTASILFLDLDGMKMVNDTHGHQAGDDLLRELSGLLCESCRETDIVARYGGDEFVVLMPGTDELGARRVALEVDRAIARRNAADRSSAKLSASMGMHTAGGDDVDSLLREADRSMYATKRSRGRGSRSR